MRIGDFARLGSVSVRALRFYDATGLLRATHVDPDSGYRHYGPEQIVRLHQIRVFQDFGFSLVEIRDLLRRDLSAGSMRVLMEQRRSELKRHIREDVARLARVERRLRDLATRKSGPSPIIVREARDAWVVSLREKLRRYDEAEELFQELESKVPQRWITGERAAFWHMCEQSGGRIDCEVIRYLKRPVPPLRGLRSYHLPAATIASVFHSGGEDTVSQSYEQLNRWLATSEFRLQGAKREIYWIEEGNKAGSKPLTKIQYPLLRGAAKRSAAA
jgi:DNA-binding transcriptional MerR regulator